MSCPGVSLGPGVVFLAGNQLTNVAKMRKLLVDRGHCKLDSKGPSIGCALFVLHVFAVLQTPSPTFCLQKPQKYMLWRVMRIGSTGLRRSRLDALLLDGITVIRSFQCHRFLGCRYEWCNVSYKPSLVDIVHHRFDYHGQSFSRQDSQPNDRRSARMPTDVHLSVCV